MQMFLFICFLQPTETLGGEFSHEIYFLNCFGHICPGCKQVVAVLNGFYDTIIVHQTCSPSLRQHSLNSFWHHNTRQLPLRVSLQMCKDVCSRNELLEKRMWINNMECRRVMHKCIVNVYTNETPKILSMA